MPADVVQNLLISAVLVQSPRQEQIEIIAVDAELRGVVRVKFPGFRESLDDVGGLGGLVQDFNNDWSRVCVGNDRVEVCDFIDLPIKSRRVAGTGWCACDHAKENLFSAPMNMGIAEINADCVLDAVGAEAGLAREVE